jgi:hypothetical protein
VSPKTEEFVEISASRAMIFMGNVRAFQANRDWQAMEEAARKAAGEINTLIAFLVEENDKPKNRTA